MTSDRVFLSGKVPSLPVPFRHLDELHITLGPKKSERWHLRAEVKDALGRTSEATVIVWANPYNAPPVAQAAVTGITGMQVNFSAAASSDPNQGATWDGYKRVRWDFENDGNWDLPFSDVLTASHIYSRPGTYTVIAQVRDRYAAMSTASVQVTVP